MSLIVQYLLIFMCAFLSPSVDDDLLTCVEKYDAKWGEDCSQCKYMNESYTVFFRNSCDDVLDIKCGIQEQDLRWRTFTFLAVEAGQEFQAYACKGTGKYQYWVKRTGDNSTDLPSDDEINQRDD